MTKPKNEITPVFRMLNSPNKEMASATSILSRLFRIILEDLEVTPKAYIRLVNQWLDDPLYGIANDPKRRSTIRGNLNKEVIRPDMSMRTFLKALSACTGTQSFTLTLKLKRKGSKKETEHHIEIPNLPLLVAQYIHDAPDRTGRRSKVTATVKSQQENVGVIEVKDLDEIADSLDEIGNAAIYTYRKRALPSYHDTTHVGVSECQPSSPPP